MFSLWLWSRVFLKILHAQFHYSWNPGDRFLRKESFSSLEEVQSPSKVVINPPSFDWLLDTVCFPPSFPCKVWHFCLLFVFLKVLSLNSKIFIVWSAPSFNYNSSHFSIYASTEVNLHFTCLLLFYLTKVSLSVGDVHRSKFLVRLLHGMFATVFSFYLFDFLNCGRFLVSLSYQC